MGAGGAGEKPVRVSFVGLGCAKNVVDAEIMFGHLARCGIAVVTDVAEADVVVVNTCGFIDDAKRESIDTILQAAARKQQGCLRRLVVAGCMAQGYGRELAAEIPEIDAFVGLDRLESVVEAVLGSGLLPPLESHPARRLYDHTAPRLLATGGVYAYLKVAEGCNNPCSFCQIPRLRGAFRSRTPSSLLAEAQRLEEEGITELVLVAQDTTRYGEDLGYGRDGLRRLLEVLLAGTSVPWIRFLYAYPATLDSSIFQLMRRESRLVPYLDIPFQHASRRVLAAMRRGGDARRFRELVERARDEVDGIAIRSTFIVGFPGEGEAEFDELVRFLAEVRFDHVGVFAYSCQAEAPAAALGDPVPARVKERRRRLLMRQQERIARDKLRALRGQKLTAVVEGRSPESALLLEGRLARQAPEVDGRLVFSAGTAAAGDLVEVRIRKTYAFDAVGDILRVVRPGRTSWRRAAAGG